MSRLGLQLAINVAEIRERERMIVEEGLDHFTIGIPAKQNTCQVITRRVTTSGKMTPTIVRRIPSSFLMLEFPASESGETLVRPELSLWAFSMIQHNVKGGFLNE